MVILGPIEACAGLLEMEHEEVLKTVDHLLTMKELPARSPGNNQLAGETVDSASDHRVRRFFHAVATNRATREDARAYDPVIWQGLYREMLR